jgi:cobalt-zinc-cadmium efflux system outer membrane protein
MRSPVRSSAPPIPSAPHRAARFGLGIALTLGSLAADGCVSSSTRSDVARVHELAQLSELPPPRDRGDDAGAIKHELDQLLNQRLDGEVAVRIALLANPELRARLRELGIARGQLLQASLLPNPRAEAELLPERSSELELRVEYDVTRAVLTPLRSRAYGAELEAERYRVAALVVEVAHRVRLGLLAVQAAAQRVGLARESLSGLGAAREAARALFEAGNTRELDLATEETAYARGEVELERMELAAANERERFSRVLGIADRPTSWQIEAQLPAAPAEADPTAELERATLRANLELKATREHLVALARQAGAVRAEGSIPDVTLDVHALTGAPGSDVSDTHAWRFGGGVLVGLPIFDRRQGSALVLEARFDAALERYRGLAAELRSEARETERRVHSAHDRARRYQDVILPSQRRVTEQTLLQYNAMQLGVFGLLSARRDQLDTQLAYVDTLREYWSAVNELQALRHGGRLVAVKTAEPSAAAGLGDE